METETLISDIKLEIFQKNYKKNHT